MQVALDGGEVLAAWGDAERTAAEISRFSAADARAFTAADEELRALARRLQPLFMKLPPDTQGNGAARPGRVAAARARHTRRARNGT